MNEYAELSARWAERDSRYGIRKVGGLTMPLTPEEIRAIVNYRKNEVDDLPDSQHDVAMRELMRWSVPVMTIR